MSVRHTLLLKFFGILRWNPVCEKPSFLITRWKKTYANKLWYETWKKIIIISPKISTPTLDYFRMNDLTCSIFQWSVCMYVRLYTDWSSCILSKYLLGQLVFVRKSLLVTKAKYDKKKHSKKWPVNVEDTKENDMCVCNFV